MSTSSRPLLSHLMDHPAFDTELRNFVEKECQYYERIDERPPFVVNRNSRLQGFSALRIDDSGKRTTEKIRVEPRTWNDNFSVLVASIDDKKRLVQKAVGGSGGYSLRIWLGHDHHPTSKLIAKPEYEPSSEAIPQKRRRPSAQARLSSDSDSYSEDTPSLSPSPNEPRFENWTNPKRENPNATDTNANQRPRSRSVRVTDEQPSTSDVNRAPQGQDGHVSKRSRVHAQALENMLQGIRDRKGRQIDIGAKLIDNSTIPSVNPTTHASAHVPPATSRDAQARAANDRTLPTTSTISTNHDGAHAEASKPSQANADASSGSHTGVSPNGSKNTAPATSLVSDHSKIYVSSVELNQSQIRDRGSLLRKKLEHLEALQRSMNLYQDSMIALQKELIDTDVSKISTVRQPKADALLTEPTPRASITLSHIPGFSSPHSLLERSTSSAASHGIKVSQLVQKE
ncbi:MAG: hypothetical protein L6R41_007853 [Letrouitia leprolyta]|nr:MAG: hypothetical protein L6R41_007853 [Letrouitia leprolyta]